MVSISIMYSQITLNIQKLLLLPREELKKLKKSLKEDYLRNEEEMPETIKQKEKRERKKPKVKPTMSESIAEKLEVNLICKLYLLFEDETFTLLNYVTEIGSKRISKGISKNQYRRFSRRT